MPDRIDPRVSEIVADGLERRRLGKEDSIYLLSFPEDSPEADLAITSAEALAREVSGGVGEIGVQIGVHIGPCMADCGFCSFACSMAYFDDYIMDVPTLRRYLKRVTDDRTVSSVSLMTIHDFDFDRFLENARAAREALPEGVRLVSNTGDLDPGQCRDLKEAGIDWAYHALRLREGIDNLLEPYDRFETIRNLKEAGIRVATGVEPIGPEHTAREIADGFWKAWDIGCDCCSASAREPVPGTRLCRNGAISDRRLRQIRSALVLCSTWADRTPLGFYGGVYGGFGKVLTEYSSSPKDLEEFTEDSLGRTVEWGRRVLRAEGYTSVRLTDGGTEPL